MNIRNAVLVTVGALIVSALVWVGKGETSTVKLGVIAGTTGQYASAGEGYLKGFELAREEWNRTHSLQFSAVIEDDGFDSKKGMSAYTKLKSIDSVDAYAILSTFTIDVVKDDVTKTGTPVALGFEQSTAATDDTIFQILPAARPVQQKLGERLQDLGYKKPFAVVSDNTPVYENFYSGFVEGYGGVAHKEMVHDDAVLARAFATKILASNADVVVFFTAPKDGALVVRELVRQSTGPLPQLAFDQSIQSGMQDYKEILGANFTKLDGAIVALSKNDLTRDFKDLYRETYNADAPFAADMGYNSFMLLATTYDTDQTKWVRNMKVAKFVGADGEVSFDPAGLRLPNVAFGTLQNGEVVVR